LHFDALIRQHLALFEGDIGRDLQNKLKDYVQARIDLYRMSARLLPVKTNRILFY
jgi:hypothetical protein